MRYDFREDISDLCIYTFEPIILFIKEYELDRAEVMFKLSRFVSRNNYILTDESIGIFKRIILENKRKRRNYQISLCRKKKEIATLDESSNLKVNLFNNQNVIKLLCGLNGNEIVKLSYELNIPLQFLTKIRDGKMICTTKIYESIVNKKTLL